MFQNDEVADPLQFFDSLTRFINACAAGNVELRRSQPGMNPGAWVLLAVVLAPPRRAKLYKSNLERLVRTKLPLFAYEEIGFNQRPYGELVNGFGGLHYTPGWESAEVEVDLHDAAKWRAVMQWRRLKRTAMAVGKAVVVLRELLAMVHFRPGGRGAKRARAEFEWAMHKLQGL